MKQKTCQYCTTPAEILATSCASCGSALPVAAPRKTRGSWPFRKAAYISIAISVLLGGLYGVAGGDGSGFKGPLAGVILLWIFSVMPGMLAYALWKNAGRAILKILEYLAIGIGVWVFNILVVFGIAAAISPSEEGPLAVESENTGGHNDQTAEQGIAVGDVPENQ